MSCVANCMDSWSLPLYADMFFGDVENEGELWVENGLVPWETTVLCYDVGTRKVVSGSHCEIEEYFLGLLL